MGLLFASRRSASPLEWGRVSSAAFVLWALVLAWALPCPAAGFVTITAPDSVGVGQPFLVRLDFGRRPDTLEVIWDGQSMHPEVTGEDAGCRAVLLLGASLSAEPGERTLEIRATLGNRYFTFRHPLVVVAHEYQRESVSVDPDLVTPPESAMDRIKAEREQALTAIRTVSPQRKWSAPFSLPVKGKKLSRFGLHRVFNGTSKRRHKGLDFRAWLGTPIHAIAPGTVVLTGEFYFGGNCVFLDHGNGVVSMYAHLSKVLVAEGDEVAAGQKIGLSGATGRATGAHLHLSVFAQGVSIDPEPLFSLGETAASASP